MDERYELSTMRLAQSLIARLPLIIRSQNKSAELTLIYLT